VEHDPQIMLEADRLLDMGPGAGEHGGTLVFNGTPTQILRAKGSLTGDYLSGRRRIEAAAATDAIAIPANRKITLHEASLHNVQSQTLELPLGHLVCVTGVSGSGKSTLVTELLYPALQRHFGRSAELAGTFRRLDGANNLSAVVLVDQSPIGRTPRSNPASFVGAFDSIRAQFAKLPDALDRKYTPGTFSFNSGTGRCPTCGGNGFEHIEMQLLSRRYLRCPSSQWPPLPR
jgi:excinuclease ABC subunit A